MSISSSLSNALTGLTTAARAAELVSSNVANASTSGYVRRDLELSVREVGGAAQGVRVVGVTRNVDLVLLFDRRVAEAAASDRDARASFYSILESALGNPDEENSISGRIASLDAALIEAASHPESGPRLANVLESAQNLAAHIGAASDKIQTSRATADGSIKAQVEQLNSSLARVEEINIQIRANTAAGRDASGLKDLRQQQIDLISQIIPVREVAREHGMVALYSIGGATLLDGKASVFEFNPAGVISPDMTLASGALSGISMNGRLMDARSAGMLSGGSLAAQAAIRDELAPAAQERLDAVARDLIARFADAGLDTTRASGDPGLFTDQGAAFSSLDEVGVAQRLTVNALVDPARGGALWRLRDGLGMATPSALSGDSTLLTVLQQALAAPRVPASGGFMQGARSLSALAADMVSGAASARLSAATEASFSAARAGALKEQELTNGVDTDQEMQKLLLIEQAYSANAKVVQTVDDMIKALLNMI